MSAPTDALDALKQPVMCHADCDCPSATPYCVYDTFGGITLLGTYCHAPCTSVADCPIVNPVIQGAYPVKCQPLTPSGPSLCLY